MSATKPPLVEIAMRLMLAAVIVAVTAGLAGCGPDGPVVDRDRIEAAKAAADSMAARFEAADPNGAPPRASDPAVADDLATLHDAGYIAGLETLPIAEGAALGDWGTASTRIGLAYLLWGTGLTTPDQLGNDEAAFARVNENTVAYREELGPYLDFSLRMTEAIARSTAAHLATLGETEREAPEIRSGSDQVRAGFAQTISGMIDLFDMPGIPDDWLAARLPALESAKATAASFLPPEVWQALAEQARDAAGRTTDPEIATALADFAR